MSLPPFVFCITGNEVRFTNEWSKTILGCRELFRRRILEGDIVEVQEDFELAFQVMLDFQGGLLRGPLDPQLSPAQDALRRSCLDTPGMCDLVLDEYCSQFTREQIESRAELIDWCGCFSPPDPLIEAEWEEINPGAPFPKACDTVCNRTDSVKLASDILLQSEGCDANLCIISNVTVVGDAQVTVTQQCLGCTSTRPCLCILDKNLVTGSLNGCSDALCFTPMEGPAGPILTRVDCSPSVEDSTGDTQTTLAISLIISVGLIAIILVILFAL